MPLSSSSSVARMEGFTESSVLLLLCVVLLLACSTQANQVEYCDKKASYPVAIEGIEIVPKPIARGKPATFKISASNLEGDLTKGKVLIDVKYFGMHIHQEIRELCREASCPISTGDFILFHEETLPSFTPPGSYTLTMKMIGEKGKLLTCFNFDFGIVFMSPVSSSWIQNKLQSLNLWLS